MEDTLRMKETLRGMRRLRGPALKYVKANLKALASGRRPAFLWDKGVLSEGQALAVVEACGHLRVLSLAGDFVFVDAQPTIARLRSGMDEVAFVSLAGRAPTVLESAPDAVQGDAAKLAEALSEAKGGDVLHVDPSDGTGMAGLLLGYPVVYCQASSDSNCLENIDLSVIGVKDPGLDVHLFSFSYPARLEPDVAAVLAPWRARMEDCGLQIETTTAHLPSVAL